MRLLMELLADMDEETQTQSCFAIRQLCMTPKIRAQFHELNGLPALISLAASESTEIRREVAATFRNLSLNEKMKAAMVTGE
jgi:hypothetical protein